MSAKERAFAAYQQLGETAETPLMVIRLIEQIIIATIEDCAKVAEDAAEDRRAHIEARKGRYNSFEEECGDKEAANDFESIAAEIRALK